MANPSLQSLPAGEKVKFGENGTCAIAVGSELRPTCDSSCLGACTTTVRNFNEQNKALTGFELDERALGKVLRACERQCAKECMKGGKAFDFAVPSRSLF